MIDNKLQYQLKKGIDKVAAVFLIVLLSPLLAIIALAVRLDSGRPVLFRQMRLGYQGKCFSILKFRTMVPDAVDLRNPDGSTYNAPDDARVTRVGKILRTLSFDELPQLFNIVKGEMSFIGPRPDLPEFISVYDERQMHKLDVLPGVTGLAQVNGRNEIPYARRLEYDLRYIERFSLLLDAKILLKTIANVACAKGLYIKRD